MTTTAGAFSDIIAATERGGYLVASESQPGAWWLVQCLPGRLECPCPRGRQITREMGTFRHARVCRHGRRLLDYVKAFDVAHKRPTFPPATSAMVD